MTDPSDLTAAEPQRPQPEQPVDEHIPTHDGLPEVVAPSLPVAPVAASTWPLPPTLPAQAAASAEPPASAEAPAPAPPAEPPASAEAPATAPPAEPPASAEAPATAPPPLPDVPAVAPTSPVSLTKPPTDPPVAAPPAVLPVVAEEPVEDESAPPDEVTPSGARGLLVPVLAALLVVLLGLTGFLGWKASDTAGAPAVEMSRTQALASARDAARAVFSYDYRHLAKDFAAGKAVTTGTFADQYSGTTAKLLDFAAKNKATVAADVSDASVVRATETEVVCLVFVNQTSSSSAVETPRITQSRLEMTMKRRGSSWLVASINAL